MRNGAWLKAGRLLFSGKIKIEWESSAVIWRPRDLRQR